LPLLRRPWAQTVLPFVTSLTLHAAIVVAAVAIAVGGGRIYRAVSPLETQATPTDTAIVEAGIGGVEHVGVFNEPSRPPAQDEKCRALSDGLLFATPDNKRKAFKWLDEQTTTGTTNPIPGLELAFKAKPQLIYLLTDADFPDNNAVKTAIARLNKAKQTRINTIVFVPGDGDDGSAGFVELMKQIASDNGG